MTQYVYVKEPGLLLDMMFLLKVYFNGEEAYVDFRDSAAFDAKDEEYYELIRKKADGISDKLLPLFYHRAADGRAAPLIRYMQLNWREYVRDESSVISAFFMFLRDWTRLKRFVFVHYFPSADEPDDIDLCGSSVRDTVLSSEYPSELKMYLLNFFMSADSEAEFLISQLRMTRKICEEIWSQFDRELSCCLQLKNDARTERIFKRVGFDPQELDKVCITPCCILRKNLSVFADADKPIIYIGIKANIDFFGAEDIDLMALARCLNDEQRIKILNMLRKQEMYCAEVARELGLANNSTIYHLKMMQAAKLLSIRSKGNKILYRINKEYLSAIEEYVKEVILEETIRESTVERVRSRSYELGLAR